MEDKQETEVRTFLITDARGNTCRTQEHGDEAAGALAARCAQFADAAVTSLGGRLLGVGVGLDSGERVGGTAERTRRGACKLGA